MESEIIEDIVIENKIKKNEIAEKKNIITNLQYNVKLGNDGDYEIKSNSSKIIYENGVEIVLMEGVIATFTDNQDRKAIITSDKASFNSSTYDTKFTDNIKILYENHKITSDKINFDYKKKQYFDFSKCHIHWFKRRN